MTDAPQPTPGANSDSIAFWSGAQGEKWSRLQKRIDAMLGPFGCKARERLAIKRGEHGLDVGCGTGDTSLELADAVGPEGSVTGIDVSRPMLQKATARASTIPELNLRFIEADAQTHDLPAGRFDFLFSRFGVMFFGDPVAAFANLRSAARPGGRIGFVCWRDPADNPWATLPARVARAHVELPPRPPANAPGQFGFADEAYVRQVLETAGWADIAVERFDTRIALGRDTTEAADFLIEMGPAGPALAEAGAETRRRAHADLRAALEDHAGTGGVRMDYSTWIVTARIS